MTSFTLFVLLLCLRDMHMHVDTVFLRQISHLGYTRHGIRVFGVNTCIYEDSALRCAVIIADQRLRLPVAVIILYRTLCKRGNASGNISFCSALFYSAHHIVAEIIHIAGRNDPEAQGFCHRQKSSIIYRL